MEKDPVDRYETAQGMANDLQRFLDNRPLLSKPPSLANRIRKWSIRHVALVWTLVLGSLTLATGLGISTAAITASRNTAQQQREQAEVERQTAVEQRNAANQNLYYAEMTAGQIDVADQNHGGLYGRLLDHLPLPGEADHRDWEWYYLMSVCRPEVRTIHFPGWLVSADWSPQGKHIGAPGVIWNAETGECVRQVDMNHSVGHKVSWSPNGDHFAWATQHDDGAIYIWERSTDTVRRLAGHEDSVRALAWSPNGRRIASGSGDHTMKVWDLATDAVEWSVPRDWVVGSLAWNQDADLLAIASDSNWPGRIEVFDVLSKKRVHAIDFVEEQLNAIRWHPDGKVLAICCEDRWFLVNRDDWSVSRERQLSRGSAIAWSPDGSELAVAHGETATIWDRTGERRIAELRGHTHHIGSVEWAPTDRRLVTTDLKGTVKLWDLAKPITPLVLRAGKPIRSIRWLDDNQTLISIDGQDGSSSFWNSSSGVKSQRLAAAIENAKFTSPDGRLVADDVNEHGELAVLEAANGATHAVLQFTPGRTLESVDFSADGTRAVTQTRIDRALHIEFWDVDAERRMSSHIVQSDSASGDFDGLTWSLDGAMVAAAGHGDFDEQAGGAIHVFDASDGKRTPLRGCPEETISIAWSRHGRHLACGTTDGRVVIMDLETREVNEEKIHSTAIEMLAWHPAGRRLVCRTEDGNAKLLTSDSLRVLLSFSAGQQHLSAVAWSGDGRRLAGSTREGDLIVWDASTGYELSKPDGPRRGELAYQYWTKANRTDSARTESALQEFFALAPDELQYWEVRGAALAQLGEYQRAAKEFSKGAEPKMQWALRAARNRAYALLGDRNLDRYREQCVRLVEVFHDSPVPRTRGSVAWLCALTQNDVVDSQQVVQLAESSLDHSKNRVADFLALTLGASLFRNGQHQESTRVLTALVEKLTVTSDWTWAYEVACAKYFLSMSRWSLGHKFQSRRLLNEANASADSYLSRAPGTYWKRIVVLQTLRQEATAALAD